MAANFSMDGQAMVKDEQFRMEDEEGANTAFFLDIGQVCCSVRRSRACAECQRRSEIGRAEDTTSIKSTESRCLHSSRVLQSAPWQLLLNLKSKQMGAKKESKQASGPRLPKHLMTPQVVFISFAILENDLMDVETCIRAVCRVPILQHSENGRTVCQETRLVEQVPGRRATLFAEKFLFSKPHSLQVALKEKDEEKVRKQPSQPFPTFPF